MPYGLSSKKPKKKPKAGPPTPKAKTPARAPSIPASRTGPPRPSTRKPTGTVKPRTRQPVRPRSEAAGVGYGSRRERKVMADYKKRRKYGIDKHVARRARERQVASRIFDARVANLTRGNKLKGGVAQLGGKYELGIRSGRKAGPSVYEGSLPARTKLVIANPSKSAGKIRTIAIPGMAPIPVGKVSKYATLDPVTGKHNEGESTMMKLGQASQPLNIARTLGNMGVATVEDPIGVAKGSAKQGRDILYGALPALIATGAGVVKDTASGKLTQPTLRKEIGKMGADVAERYTQSSKEQRERFKKEGYLLEGLELSPIGRGASLTFGLTKTGQKLRGPQSRPDIRVSGDIVEQQYLSNRVGKALMQRWLDKQRSKRVKGEGLVGKRNKKRILENNERLRDSMVRHGNRAEGAETEITPLWGGLTRHKLRRRVATQRSRGRQAEVEALRKDAKLLRTVMRNLSKAEQRAFYYVATGQAPALASTHKAQILEWIDQRIEQITTNRQEAGDTRGGGWNKTDELKNLEWLKDHVDEAFTPQLRQTVRDLRKSDLDIAHLDPALVDVQAALRRVAQQADALGIRRGDVSEGLADTATDELLRLNRELDNALKYGIARKRKLKVKKEAVAPVLSIADKLNKIDLEDRGNYELPEDATSDPDRFADISADRMYRAEDAEERDAIELDDLQAQGLLDEKGKPGIERVRLSRGLDDEMGGTYDEALFRLNGPDGMPLGFAKLDYRSDGEIMGFRTIIDDDTADPDTIDTIRQNLAKGAGEWHEKHRERDYLTDRRRAIETELTKMGDKGSPKKKAILQKNLQALMKEEAGLRNPTGPRLGFNPHDKPIRRKAGKHLFHGRGLLDADGRLHTWFEDEGTHADYVAKHGLKQPVEEFMIRPDGTIQIHGGSGRNHDHYIGLKAVEQDPRLKYDVDLVKSRKAVEDFRARSFASELTLPGVKDEVNAMSDRAIAAIERAMETRPDFAELTDPDAPFGYRKAKKAEIDALKAKAEAALDRVNDLTRDVPELAYAPGETDLAFLRRIFKEAAETGRERPLYFPSQKYPMDSGVVPAVQTGPRAMGGPQQYTGKNFYLGRQDTRPEVYLAGRARSIRRRFNWQLVKDQVEKHALKEVFFTDDQGNLSSIDAEGTKLAQLRDRLIEAGVDLNTVSFYHPGRFESRFDGRFRDPNEDTDMNADQDDLAAAMAESIVEGKSIKKGITGANATSTGWRVVPREVMDEIQDEVGPVRDKRGAGIARGWDAAKALQARVLLGTNPSWLLFQVLSNATLATAAVRGNLADFARMPLWWRNLDEQTREELVPIINAGSGHGEVYNVPMGPRSDNLITRQWDALRRTPIGQAIGKANPITRMLDLDQKQNAYFRKVVLYNQAKRDAYNRMNQSAEEMLSLQDQLMGILDRRNPEERIAALLKERDSLERYSQRMNEFLGDYTTYTAFERSYIRRFVMFYGFLRFSLRFTFYTMPVKHPVMTAILANMGKMQTDEVRELLGGDELPWALGRLYWKQDGKVMSVDLQRMNPAGNQFLSIKQPGQIFSMLPPVVVAVGEQGIHRSLYKDRDWKQLGKAVPHSPEHKDYGLEERARIFGGSMLKLVAPYRMTENATQEGPHGDDSLLWDPRPTKYVDKNILRDVNRGIERERAEDNRFLKELVPIIPRESFDPELAESIRAKKKPKKAKPKPKTGWGTSGGGGWGTGSGGGGGW